MTQRITDEVIGWIAQVTNEEEFAGLNVSYDAAMTALPNGGREDQWVPFLVLYLGIDGPSDDSNVFSAPIVRPYAVREQFVKDLVRDGIRSLVVARDKAIAESESITEVAESSG